MLERRILGNRSLGGPGRRFAANGRIEMSQTIESKNKALVLEAFDTLFNKRDYVAAEHYWSPDYIQHSAHIEPGREGLFKLIKSLPPTLRYESGTIVAEGDFVIVHGRFSDFGAPVNSMAERRSRSKRTLPTSKLSTARSKRPSRPSGNLMCW